MKILGCERKWGKELGDARRDEVLQGIVEEGFLELGRYVPLKRVSGVAVAAWRGGIYLILSGINGSRVEGVDKGG